MPPQLDTRYLPAVGATLDDFDTPALCLDLDVMESNIAQIAADCRARGVGWRPHFKGLKVPAIAQQEVDAGAIGITCAKLSEAELLAEQTQIRDLLVANMLAGPHKVRRLVELRRAADPVICVDHADQLRPIGQAMSAAGLEQRVIIEVDIGLHRVGVAPGEATLHLAQLADALPGIRLAGLMGYEGHLLTVPDRDQKATLIRDALALLVECKDRLEQAGLSCPIVSCAGTGSYRYAIQQPGITEVQAGGAIFMDAFYRHACQVERLDYALTVLTTVVSRPAPERAIIDAGRKTMNIEVHTPLVLGRSDIRVKRLSAEHGQLELDPSAYDLKIGDRLRIVPGYADLTTVLHDCFLGMRRGKLVAILPIEGRGRLQ